MKYIEFETLFNEQKGGTYEHPVNAKIVAEESEIKVILYPAWSKENMNICWKLEMYVNNKFHHEFRTPDKGTMEWYITCNVRYFFNSFDEQ